jgi:2-aminoadipate transaminase
MLGAMAASTIRYQQVEIPEGMIDLGLGQPQNELLPLDHVRRAASCIDRIDILQYGAEWGDGWYRVALGEYLTSVYGIAVDPEHLFATNGNSQALDMVCSVYSRPGDVVFVEDPTYFIALRTFADHHLDVRPVRVDDEGMDVEHLAELLAALRSEGRSPAFVHVIPTFQNPTGATLSAERRARLVALSEEYHFVVVADEVYHLLRYTDVPPPPPMAAFDGSGTVVSLGTFSKIFAPGLRLGWVHGVPELLAPFEDYGVVTSGGGLNPISGLIATTVMQEGWLEEYRTSLSSIYAGRVSLMDAELRAALPDDVMWTAPTGGYFFWLGLPARLDVGAVRARCLDQGVDLRVGSLFSPIGTPHPCVRLSFTFYADDDLREGVRRLARAFGGREARSG